MVRGANSLDGLLDGLRAAADSSRLRLLAICSQGEWTVSELVQVKLFGPSTLTNLPRSRTMLPRFTPFSRSAITPSAGIRCMLDALSIAVLRSMACWSSSADQTGWPVAL